MPTTTLPVCLVIMDGFGLAEPSPGNAISLARTPILDELMATCPHTALEASGVAVGLPAGQMGNSEVGHLNIGAGRVVHQELSRIDEACGSGELATNPVLSDAFHGVVERDATLHLMGLLSDGGVHSSIEHLYAIMEAAVAAGVQRIRIHCFLDGRDVPPESGRGYLAALEERIAHARTSVDGAAPDIRIASIMGRYFAMDRDNRWDRVERAYRVIVEPEGADPSSPDEIVARSYAEGVTDEFVVPVSLVGEGVDPGDAIVFCNFRPDRARELTRAIVDEGFEGFPRERIPNVSFVCLTEYDPAIDAPVAFPKAFPENVLADVLSDAGLQQFHIAETEKYAHVTFFLNGGIEEQKQGERRVLIPSPKVATYDLMPEMSEPEVARTLCEAIDADAADVYIVNFANCDMVGHTGIVSAATAAVEAVDEGVGKVVEAMGKKGGVVLVTADHGNADKMLDADGAPFTAHTTNLVPLVLVDRSGQGRKLRDGGGRLADIAPTLLDIIGIEKPAEMTGESLLA